MLEGEEVWEGQGGDVSVMVDLGDEADRVQDGQQVAAGDQHEHQQVGEMSGLSNTQNEYSL